MEARSSTLFREIHKNTWLKRLSVDNKKVLVGPKVRYIIEGRRTKEMLITKIIYLPFE